MSNAPSDGPGSLSALRDLGPFFAVLEHGDEAPRAPWRAVTDLLADPAPRVEQVRAYLASGADRAPQDVERRVAASVAHLGLVARLLSPWVALAADGVRVPVAARDLRWVPMLGSGFQLSVGADVLARDRPSDLSRWAAGVLRDLVLPVAAAVGGPPSVVWGNTASALDGAVTAASTARPDLTPALIAVAQALLEVLPGQPVHTGGVGGRDFRRRSCCLIYRVGGAGRPRAVCGDCVLTP